MKLTKASIAVAVILLFGMIAAHSAAWRTPVAVAVSYISVGVLVIGLCYRFALWKRSAVPFRIPVTCGPQTALPWLKRSRLDNPDTPIRAAIRVAAEILLFRSLFRDHRPEIKNGSISYVRKRSLWWISMVFHYSLMIVMLRHLSLAFERIPVALIGLQRIDTLFEISGRAIHLSDFLLIVSLVALFVRRISDDRVRFISLFTDYFALLLLLAISVTGVWIEFFSQNDVAAIKQFVGTLSSFHPAVHASIPPSFLVHRTLVGALLGYLPFSKLLHFGGIAVNPIYNLPNNSRACRHVNPWDSKVARPEYVTSDAGQRESSEPSPGPEDK